MEEKIMEMFASIIENQKQMNTRLDQISSQLDQIEVNSKQDVIGLLEVINTKLEKSATKHDIDYLAVKFGQYDLEIDRLKRVK